MYCLSARTDAGVVCVSVCTQVQYYYRLPRPYVTVLHFPAASALDRQEAEVLYSYKI